MALPLAERRDAALTKRAISSVILVAIATTCLWLGGWAFAVLTLVALAGMAVEWGRLAPHPVEPTWLLPVVVAVPPALAVLAAAAGRGQWAVLVLALGAIGASGTLSLARKHAANHAGLGVLYLGLATLSLVWLVAQVDGGAARTLWLLLIIWTTDIFAYVVGRRLGGPKLAPHISPGKTWSGLVGGVVAAALVGAMAHVWLGGGPVLGAMLGAVLAVVSQIGDLYESSMKRRAGYKDSGRMIPGHGGVLDRLDGLVFAAPVYTVLVLAVVPGALS